MSAMECPKQAAFLLTERPVLKLLCWPVLVRRPVRANLCTDYPQIWQGGGGHQYLITAKVENFRGSFGEYRPKKKQKTA